MDEGRWRIARHVRDELADAISCEVPCWIASASAAERSAGSISSRERVARLWAGVEWLICDGPQGGRVGVDHCPLLKQFAKARVRLVVVILFSGGRGRNLETSSAPKRAGATFGADIVPPGIGRPPLRRARFSRTTEEAVAPSCPLRIMQPTGAARICPGGPARLGGSATTDRRRLAGPIAIRAYRAPSRCRRGTADS